MHPTKQQLIEAGLPLLLQHGYNDLGIATLLASTGIPKGSFYHHFADKESFALAVVDAYMVQVHAALDATLCDQRVPPLQRIRAFFAAVTESYLQQGNLGCLLGGLGQELSGASDVFRAKISECFLWVERRLSQCLVEAKQQGDLPADSDPEALGALLVDCWEGAALRSRLRGDSAPLEAMLDFFLASVSAAPG